MARPKLFSVSFLTLPALGCGVFFLLSVCVHASESVTAFIGGTIIDGNGGEPLADATLLVVGGEIAAVGPRGEVDVPDGAHVIDAEGHYLLPGFIDINVHVSHYRGGETLLRYADRQAELVAEHAQLHLKYGVTTIRDSYGALGPLVEIRDAIAAGELVGPRLKVAGNIVGWGGPCSVSFSMVRPDDCHPREREFNDEITMGVSGEDLLTMTPDELGDAIGRYLDLGPDHLRYGAVTHFADPAFITFSPDAQRAIVKAAHARGIAVETHSTTLEGMRIPILAGVDMLLHPELLLREVPDWLLDMVAERELLCGFRATSVTGEAWQAHLDSDDARDGEGLSLQRHNAERFIKGGCVPAVGNDNHLWIAPELRDAPRSEGPRGPQQHAGLGTLLAIEGLVELGLTPGEAIVAATRNGAKAARGLDRYGTLEPGKLADVVMLERDPLADIANIHSLVLVMFEGTVIDRDALPTRPVWYGHPNF